MRHEAQLSCFFLYVEKFIVQFYLTVTIHKPMFLKTPFNYATVLTREKVVHTEHFI